MRPTRMFKNIFFRYRIIQLRMGESNSKLSLFCGKKTGFRISLLALIFLLLNFISLHAADSTPSFKNETLTVGFTNNAFLGVQRSDAEAAFKAFVRTVGINRGYNIDIFVKAYENPHELAEDINANKIQLIIIDTWSYLEMGPNRYVKPLFVSSHMDRASRRYLLLSHRNSSFETINDLRGKTLNVLKAPNMNLGTPWLKTALKEQNLKPMQHFFASTKDFFKPHQVVLPVFFGQVDACLVDSSSFELMQELNPQLGEQMKILAVSEPLVNAITCLSENNWSSEIYRQDIIKALADLHLEVAGEQILSLFRTGRLLPFEENHLENVRELMKKSLSHPENNKVLSHKVHFNRESKDPKYE